MTRQQLERRQVWIYAGAILVGLGLGAGAPMLAPVFEMLIWPVLGLLLYATFTQVPLTHLRTAFTDARFMGALLTGNFLFLPLVVWGLVGLLPDDPVVRFGVLLVLLVPCTDWFLAFTHLGGGDTRRAIAATPVLLLVQIALLPVYLWLLLGETFIAVLPLDRVATVFLTLIVLPLISAFLTERFAERRPERAVMIKHLGWLPVPLLALVVLLVAASQVHVVTGALPVLIHVLGVFLAFLVVAAVVGVATARLFGLETASARTLVFSLGTRNSFLVLPFLLALPPYWEVAIVIVVLQTLVELFGMIAYLMAVPRYLLPSASRRRCWKP
jgi:arsenite transporter